jgi:hypothetical protein
VEARARVCIGREKVTGPRPGKLAVVRSRRWYDLRHGVGPALLGIVLGQLFPY